MKRIIVLVSLITALAPNAFGSGIEPQRAATLGRADVWSRPSWMNSDLSFVNDFDIRSFVQVRDSQELLNSDELHCLMTQSYATQDRGTGKSPKFNCDLMKLDSRTGKLSVVLNSKRKPVKLKVKYSIETVGMSQVVADSNAEVQAEVMSTRLLSALGFTTDKMFLIKKLNCYGCSIDPWNIRELDQSTLRSPRRFKRVSVEFKAEGDEILNGSLSGWSPQEILAHESFSNDPSLAKEQLLEREALLLLGGLLQHSDNKPDNHRIICDGKLIDGQCSGSVKLMFQDLGLSFGGGTILVSTGCVPWCSSKAELQRWKNVSLWRNEETRPVCTVNMGWNAAWHHPVISEEARLFTLKLLKKFTEGDAGRKRLLALFDLADLEAAGRGKSSDWAIAFMDKIDELANPALSDNNHSPGDPFDRFRRETRADRAKDAPLRCEGSLEDSLEKILDNRLNKLSR